jgi:hypothetical protein
VCIYHPTTGVSPVCSEPRPIKPSDEAFLRNLRQPVPAGRKVVLVVKNAALKVVRLRSCCGNHGEPGC